MRIEWQRILSTYHIEWVDSGPNVKRGNTNIKCPFCGEADPSYHMGLAPTGQWACWRNDKHRGANPATLLAKAARITYNVASEVLHLKERDYADISGGFSTAVRASLSKDLPNAAIVPGTLRLPVDFRPLWQSSYARTRYLDYMERRGFVDVEKISKKLRLYYAPTGQFAGRVIFPFYSFGELVHWTGRSIYGSAELRYRALPASEAIDPFCLYGFDDAYCGGSTLLVLEGPMDAAKVNAYSVCGVRAVAVATSSPNTHQVDQISLLTGRFKYTIMSLDRGELLKAVSRSRSFVTEVRVSEPPYRAKDFGELSRMQIKAACVRLSKGEVF